MGRFAYHGPKLVFSGRMMTELKIIELLARWAPDKAPGMVRGIGDDCAIFRPRPREDLLFTTDLLVEDVHFRRTTHTARDCGHKALARGLSDIAAMGGRPRFCLLSLAVGKGLDQRWVEGFYKGLLELATETDCPLAGGDLAHADQTAADIIVCGAVPRGKALRRDTAKPGDGVFVTGALGVSALGLATGKGLPWRRHLRPEPRLAAGLALRRLGATAAMDLSDGLSIDLHRLAKASGVAAMLDGDLPAFEGATLAQALHGGEDYELLFTLGPRKKAPLEVAGLPVTRIGRIIEGPPGQVRVPGGILQPLGYDHFRK